MGVVQISISQNNPMRHPISQNKTARMIDALTINHVMNRKLKALLSKTKKYSQKSL